MENRFGFKDVIFCGLITVSIVVAGMAMWQIQRQGEVITEVRTRLERQDALLTRLDERAKAAKPGPAAAPVAPVSSVAPVPPPAH